MKQGIVLAEKSEIEGQIPLHSHREGEHHCLRCGLPITRWQNKKCLPYNNKKKNEGSKKKTTGVKDVGALLRMSHGICSLIPMGKQIFSRIIGILAPYSGCTNAVVQELEKGRCLVSMKQSSAVRDGYIWSIPASNLIVTPSRTVFEMPQTSEVCNHLSSIHAMALVTLMVRCSQLAVAGAKPADKFESLAGLQIH